MIFIQAVKLTIFKFKIVILFKDYVQNIDCASWSCQNVCHVISYLLDDIYIRYGNTLYRQIVGIPMGTNCAPLVADLFLFCFIKDCKTSFSSDNQTDMI